MLWCNDFTTLLLDNTGIMLGNFICGHQALLYCDKFLFKVLDDSLQPVAQNIYELISLEPSPGRKFYVNFISQHKKYINFKTFIILTSKSYVKIYAGEVIWHHKSIFVASASYIFW